MAQRLAKVPRWPEIMNWASIVLMTLGVHIFLNGKAGGGDGGVVSAEVVGRRREVSSNSWPAVASMEAVMACFCGDGEGLP
jgi:hypothetical protein